MGAFAEGGGGARQADRSRRRLLAQGMSLVACPISAGAREGTLSQRTVQVPAFDSVDYRLAGALELRQAHRAQVVARAEDHVLAALQVRTEGRTLVLDAGSYRTRHPVVVQIAFETLRSLRVAGSGLVSLAAIRSEQFELLLDGSGSFRGESLNLGRLRVDSRGSDDATLVGQTRLLDLSLTGSGNVLAHGLVSGSASVVIGGSGDAELNVRQRLEARLDGSGSLRLKGRPVVVRRGEGSGELVPME